MLESSIASKSSVVMLTDDVPPNLLLFSLNRLSFNKFLTKSGFVSMPLYDFDECNSSKLDVVFILFILYANWLSCDDWLLGGDCVSTLRILYSLLSMASLLPPKSILLKFRLLDDLLLLLL